MEGIISSGPDMVHDDVKESVDSFVVLTSLRSSSLPRPARASGVGVIGSSFFLESFSCIDVVEATTQDSPSAEASEVRGCSAMA